MRFKRTCADYLRDMVEYAEKAERFLAGIGLADFQRQEQTVLAVVRALEVIGEAARHITRGFKTSLSGYTLEKSNRHAEYRYSRILWS